MSEDWAERMELHLNNTKLDKEFSKEEFLNYFWKTRVFEEQFIEFKEDVNNNIKRCRYNVTGEHVSVIEAEKITPEELLAYKYTP